MKTLFIALTLAAVPVAPVSIAWSAVPAQDDAAADAKPETAAAKFNLDTPVQDIVADEQAKAALEANLPGVTTHESYESFKGMSLNQLSTYAPDQLTPEVLAKVEKGLAEVK